MNHATAILDLQGLVTRAYHAGMSPEPLEGTEGFKKQYVNTASYGFTTFLNMIYSKVIEQVGSPMNIIAVLDDGNTYRKKLFREYKQNRSKVERDPVEVEQLEINISLVKEFLVSMGATLVQLKGEEADDVIAHLVDKLEGTKIVFTGDNDLVALAGKAFVWVKDVLKEDYEGVPYSCITVYKSLVGDSSDGYPGVAGIGQKGWDSLVAEFGYDGMEQLDELLNNNKWQALKAIATKTTNKTYLKAVENLDTWMQMYKVAKLTPSLCEGAKTNLSWFKRVPSAERLRATFFKAGCLDLMGQYDGDTYSATLVTRDSFDDLLEDIVDLIDETPFIAFDYETTDQLKKPEYKLANKGRDYVDRLHSTITGVSFALGRNCNKVFYISVNHKDTNNVSKGMVAMLLKEMEDKGKQLIAANFSFEHAITKMDLDYRLRSNLDVLLFSHHLNERYENDLKSLSRNLLNYKQHTYEETLAMYGAEDMEGLTGEQCLEYGADDAVVTAHLMSLLATKTMLEGTYKFIVEYECPAGRPLTEAHITGVKIDPIEMEKQKSADLVVVEKEMEKMRVILEEHCLEPNLAAVETLFQDQRDFIVYKAKQAGEEPKQALEDYRVTLKKGSFYQPPKETKQFSPFIPTPTMFSKVAAIIGLPPIEKIGREAITCWIEDTRGALKTLSPRQETFINLLGPAVPQFNKRAGEHYETFKWMCDQYLEENAPVTIEGSELNFNSQVQNAHLFYLLLGMPIRLRVKVVRGSLRHLGGFEGSPGTDEAAIEFALANDCAEHPWKKELLESLLVYKAASTRLGIYWEPYPLWLDDDNMMHPGFKSCGTVTRRPTGGSPNLLQVSKGNVRKIFVPRSANRVIVSVDFSSEELRVMAGVSQDATFLSAYLGDVKKDLHSLTACGILPTMLRKSGLHQDPSIVWDSGSRTNYEWFVSMLEDKSPIGKLVKSSRSYGKIGNFGKIYGAAAQTLSRQLMIPLEEAQVIADAFDGTYPGVAVWKDKLIRKAAVDGYVETLYGSRRHCGNELNSGSYGEVGRWERQLGNFVVQGTCADLLKVALTSMDRNCTLDKHGAFLLATVYDEILADVPVESLHAFLQDISDDMEQEIPGLGVPMVADCSFGLTWGEQVEVGQRPSEETVEEALIKLGLL